LILLVDIGNSRTKWSLRQDGAQQRGGVFAYDAPLFARTLDFEWRGIAAPERILVSNVAGAGVADALYLWVQNKWKLHTEFAKSQKQAHGVTNSYARADRLGVDRWLAMIAARRRVPAAPVCVVDCGTAITIDVVDAAGAHQGGLIAPGITAMCASLARSAAEVGKVHDHFPDPAMWIATDTQNGVMVGTRTAAAALIDRVIQEASARFGASLVTLVSGGDAKIVMPLLKAAHESVPDLVLDGLAVVAESGK
jgi:type III pantothenate kinase